MKKNMLTKRILSLVLAVAMLASLAACGKAPAETMQNPAEDSQYSREDKELIAELMGGQEAVEQLSDPELDALVEELTKDLEDQQSAGIVNLGNTQEKDLPTVDISENKDAYDENGAMKEPFDQVYPELIEEGKVAFSDESLLIKLSSDTLTDGLKAAGVGALEEIVPLDGCAWYEAKLVDGTDAQNALAAVRELDEVLLAEYDYQVQTAALDDYKHFDKDKDEEFKKNGHNKDQWHFHHCGIVDGYEEMEKDGGDSSVVVAVIDSGVDYDHEDLIDNMWVNSGEVPDNGRDDDGNGYVDDYYGVDIIAGKGNGDDTNGHGTHVAGIIAAKNNNTGVLGIAYNVKIMSVKAAMHNGTLNQSDIAKSVLYAHDMGADVINMSFGGTACSIAVQDALAYAYTNCVLVASAGNGGTNNKQMPNYPAALTYVLGVMSVDQYGVESSFTNWDVYPFSGVEYELYAPGENIMSTLPNNRYGFLSGTSMAAPVVSAFAAILRSEFTDRDKYPTKFIYGQLAATSGNFAECYNPEVHGGHNLPQIANLNDALTKLPKPEVNLQDYALFDDPALSDKNNGDGVIDAGETIALGLTLRNRWGMSENTQVTIDTLSASSGLADPYFTIENPTVNYGSVGTYSTQDAGRIYTDELLTGWEKPFIIQVSEDCPNDYRFTLNVTVKCENALDEKDETVYTTTGSLNENVRAGYILPSIIEEDMVLTPENLYIIPNATVIREGVTVRVEPGTHIQFWSDDPNDPYADSYIAYLVVNGKFLVKGTKEDPVYIYPSDLMDNYNVEIGATSTGYVSLKYADVTNLGHYGSGSSYSNTNTGNRINLADHCTFRMNYPGSSVNRYRALSGGTVSNSSLYNGTIGNINARDCVFYKLSYSNPAYLNGSFDRCIFNQCGINYTDNSGNSYKNCVFQTANGSYWKSSYTANYSKVPSISRVDYRPETGTTYIQVEKANGLEQQFLAEALELETVPYVIVETEEERDWLQRIYVSAYYSSDGGDAGIYYDEATGKHVWSDGSAIGAFIDSENRLADCGPDADVSLWFRGSEFTEGYLSYSGSCSHGIFEIPGPVLPTDITFKEYTVAMDLETTYQLAPCNTPVQLPVDQFLYKSTDESVLTVSDTGLVTPVGYGTADVWVYSQDRAVKNRVTFAVKDYVPLEGISFLEASMELAVGEAVMAECILYPADTTRRHVTYTSSDEGVVTAENGILRATGKGVATVTATCEGLTATAQVTAYQKATNLSLSQSALSVSLSEQTMELPQVVTNKGAEPVLAWRSTDEAVAVVKEGTLILKKEGSTSLIVTDSRSGLSAACLVVIAQEQTGQIKDIRVAGFANNNFHFVLLEDGRLYTWDGEYRLTPMLTREDVLAIDVAGVYCIALTKEGKIFEYDASRAYVSWGIVSGEDAVNQDWDITDFDVGTAHSRFIVTGGGNVYAWSTEASGNAYGQLGIGTTGHMGTPTLVNLDGVTDVAAGSNTTYFLTNQGELYAAGLHYSSVPTLCATNVKQILSEGGNYLTVDGKIKGSADYPDLSQMDQVALYAGIQDGKVYTFQSGSTQLTEIPGITDAVDIFAYGGTYYVVTAQGMLLAFGNNSAGTNHIPGVVGTVSQPVPILLQEIEGDALTVTNNGLVEDVLTEDVWTVTFNKALGSALPKLYADGVQITLQAEITGYNHLVISRAAGFAKDVRYELVIPAGDIDAVGGVTNTEEIRIAFTYDPDKVIPEETIPEETVPETTEPEEGAPTEPTYREDISIPFSLRAKEETPVVYEAIVDETVVRHWTTELLSAALTDWLKATQLNGSFYGNAILNPISTDTKVTRWLRFQAPTISSGSYREIPLGGNYWGSTNETAIGLQIIDYTDFITYARLMYAPYLTEAPENTFPFVTSVKLFNKDGEAVTVVGNEEVKFQVKFNRDMDTTIPLLVRFGSTYPYGDYEIEGRYVDARTWEGVYTLNTIIENGYQYFSISNGCSATEDLELQLDQYRFFFEIDTTAAQALIMQGNATDTGIELKWTQDDFATLMGYNVYRSTSLNGQYTRLNKTVIPADTMTWFDDTVEPGQVYYYNFTVVQTDLSESEPSGKISLMSKDTMAPNIYHSPVSSATAGVNTPISATVTDNLSVIYANLYFRVAGTEQWSTVRMNALNDKFTAIIPAQHMTLDGVEYYIEAFDGISFTYRGSAETPFTIFVREALDKNSLGDVDGNGTVTVRDALMLLQAISHKYNMKEEEFVRADLNGDGQLSAVEALRILHYVSGKVGSLVM